MVQEGAQDRQVKPPLAEAQSPVLAATGDSLFSLLSAQFSAQVEKRKWQEARSKLAGALWPHIERRLTRKAERQERERLEREAIAAALLAEEERLAAIAAAEREAAEAEARRVAEAERALFEKMKPILDIQKHVRGWSCRRRFAVKKRMRRLRTPDAFDYALVRGQGRFALTIILGQMRSLTQTREARRQLARQLMQDQSSLDGHIHEYIRTTQKASEEPEEHPSVRAARQMAALAEAKLQQARDVAQAKAELARRARGDAQRIDKKSEPWWLNASGFGWAWGNASKSPTIEVHL